MPISATDHPSHSSHPAAVAYYRTVAVTLLTHLIGRPVVGVGSVSAPPGRHGVPLHIQDATDLDEAVRSGVVSFLLPGSVGSGRPALRIRPGEDSGIDIVATAALALMELMGIDGVQTTAMLDGAGGLYLAGIRAGGRQPQGIDGSAAARYAHALADRSPEIATTTAIDTETAGRALIEPLAPGGDGMPAPYSLVHGPHGLAVIAPLTHDEVAAATAGMPLDIGMADLAERLRTRGDLALQLIEGPARDA